MSMANIISSSPSGGRVDFEDGGFYCGGWQDGKAHGHGICTGPKNVGEYSGSWNFAFEMSGVYKWSSGAVYEGRWQNGERHGVGVEYKGKWIYRGEWSQGLKGRYGVKASSNSAVKYEGTWANGLQDGYGCETYSDGGYYQGQMCRGLRQGYGVRKSAPYGDSQLNNPLKNGPLTGGPPGGSKLARMHSAAGSTQSAGSASDLAAHSSYLAGGGAANDDDRSSPKPEDGFKPNIERTLVSKNGFVLVAKPLDVPMPSAAPAPSTSDSQLGGDTGAAPATRRRYSLTNRIANSARIPNQTTASFLRGLRLRKQRSTGDLDSIGGGGARLGRQAVGAAGASPSHAADESPLVPFTLSPEELDITDPTTVETYMGEWSHDKRNGFGVCERSDGLRYEGQWHNDMKFGYGQTTFKDGTKEEGKYKNNILIPESRVKQLLWNSSKLRQRILDSVEKSRRAQTLALQKAEIADTRAATARDKADQATTAAVEAERDSQIAYSVALQYCGAAQQLQLQQKQLLMQQQAVGGNCQQRAPGASQPLFASAGQTFAEQQRVAVAAAGIISQTPSLNMAASQTQLRRLPYHQQQAAAASSTASQQNTFSQQTEQRRNHLGLVEPFNGRRGSFRGASGGAHAGQGSCGNSVDRQQQLVAPSFSARQRSAADPFSDLFDHYKPSLRSRRLSFRQQTSLDLNGSSRSSAPHQFGGGDATQGGLRNFRMASLDNDNQQPSQSHHLQHQLRHLVTSGEEHPQNQLDNSRGDTPTSSSYILQQSGGGGGGSSLGRSQATPSPSDTNYNNNSRPSPSGQPQQYYGCQQSLHDASQQLLRRGAAEANSLADEQLYLANSGRFQLERFGHEDDDDSSEFTNYDFTISSAPRPVQRCQRRTASLDRTTPISLKAPLATGSELELAPPVGKLQRWSPLPDDANATATAAAEQLKANAATGFVPTVEGADDGQSVAARPMSNCYEPNTTSVQSTDVDSSNLSSVSTLYRKPSLQVRYDPNELGGLMSREEVAAMSHAQREQKRFEAERAEQRAKQPLLHIYLTLREFASRHQLILTLLVINICLIKMFDNLIA